MQTTDLRSIPTQPSAHLLNPFEFRKQLLQVPKVTQLKDGLKIHFWQLCLLQRAVSGTGGSFGRLAGDLVKALRVSDEKWQGF